MIQNILFWFKRVGKFGVYEVDYRFKVMLAFVKYLCGYFFFQFFIVSLVLFLFLNEF